MQIKIPLTENDLDDFQSGEVFDWTFTTEEGVDIQVRIGAGDCCEECGDEFLADELTDENQEGQRFCLNCKK